MSKSRLSVLRKKELQDLAATLNIPSDGLKMDIEERVLNHLRQNESTLRNVKGFTDFYPSPRKRSPGHAANSVFVPYNGDAVKSEMKLSPPPGAPNLGTPTKRRGSPAAAASSSASPGTPSSAGRRLSTRLNQKPISIDNSEEDSSEESPSSESEGQSQEEEEGEKEGEEEEDEEEQAQKSTQMTDGPESGASWPRRVSQKFVLQGASTFADSVKSIVGQAKRTTAEKTHAAADAVVSSTRAANRRVQTTLSSVCLVNTSTALLEFAVLAYALYSQAAGVLHIQPVLDEYDTVLGGDAPPFVPVPFSVLLVQMLSSYKLFWNPVLLWLVALVLVPVVVSYYINFSATSRTDPLIYNLSRVLITYFLAEHTELIIHTSHVLSILGKLPYIGGAIGILLALYTS